ncbi:histidine kinase dimerization/phosphoacceptor domain -containing protein [Nitratireductor sp. CH_MIT9313-5]|uniref:histidine kinase dimerization/phosphoacceptor domain -containing protein n=1 Tax=Nitratireductor sp. CH_MIT9313-5 TaxID=3107764 RepID=UPI003008F9D9
MSLRAEAHPEQAERLKTLYRYQILDTPREEEFDEIVALTAQICDAPISVINIIDAERQWFKAEVGLGTRETPIDTSICAHIILDEDFVEIEDTLNDPRLADNPLCLAETGGLRFYAGARLVAPNGMPLGTLCVLDNQPRQLNDLQRSAIRVLARQVMKQFELRLALRDQEVLRGEIDHRVKNSLQTVSSIVRLYLRSVEDETARDALTAVQRRIDAIGALHEQLQGSSSGQQIDIKRFLERVVGLLQETAPDNVRIHAEAVHAAMDSDTASALGMIVSEFVANSLKHGFSDAQGGNVTIELKEQGGEMILACSDDGLGSKAHRPKLGKIGSLGTNIMNAAASRLNGNFAQELDENGSRLFLTFPLAD